MLMHGRPRLRPAEIRRMTLAEIALALDQDIDNLDKRPPVDGVDLAQFGGMAEYHRWWKSLTPKQRLKRARRRWQEECC